MSRMRNNLRCCVRPSIGKALAADAFERRYGALGIVESAFFPLAINLDAGFAVVIAEVKFSGIALQVLRANMVERADDAALEDAEIAFNGIGMHIATDILSGFVVDRLMAGNHRSKSAQRTLAISHQASFGGIDLGFKDRLEIFDIDARNVERAHSALALDQRKDAFLANPANDLRIALAAVAILFLAAYVSSICLYRRAARSEHTTAMLHGFAYAVGHEPCRLIGHAQCALKLLAADAFLAGAHQVHGLNPNVQFDFAALENGAHSDRELFAAILALVKAVTMRLAFQLVVVFVYAAAMRADGAIRPANRLKPLAGRGFVFKLGLI